MTEEEAILESRRRWTAGEFKRKIMKSVPKDLGFDTIHLSCGHRRLWLPQSDDERPDELSCYDCADDWIKANTARERRG